MNPKPFRIGAVLFPGFELLDLYGPLEMFGLLEDRVTVSLLARETGPISGNQGVKTLAEARLADIANFDLLLIPGGLGTRSLVSDSVFIDLLTAQANAARLVATVCTGSALLAKTGLLDGQRATSNKLAFDWVTAQGPHTKWIRQARWVHDGKFYTSSGISAGIDMALDVIADVFSLEVALQIALRAEYTWNRDPALDLFA